MSKYSREELIGQDHRIINSGHHPTEFIRDLWMTIGKGKVWKGEIKNKAKDGSFYWVDTTIVPFLNEGSKPRKYVAIRSDITDRKTAEEALRKSEVQLQTILENLGEGVAVSNLSGQLLHFNRAALDQHGFASLDECRRRLTDYAETFELAGMDGKVWPVDQWPLARVLRGEKLRNLEVRIRRFQTDWRRIFSYGGTLVHSADGQPLMAVVTINDITERKRATEEIRQLNTELEQRVVERTAQLEAANQELKAFSYSVSHDLRAPLRHVMGFVELLQKDAGPSLSEKSRRHLTTISQAGKRMGDLIDDLLAFAQVGRSEMQKTELDLDQLVRKTLGDFRAETQARNIVWNIHPLPPVRADRALLRMVLVNLISNAVKFTGARAEARIEIGCAANGNSETVIYIRDNGAGFDPKYTGKLFGVFQRLHSQAEFEGTGIGLANVQRIIHRHGGRTWAEGVVDGGATFYFSIPKPMEA
jgi:PAS domain S-box-containing protein